MLFEVEEGVGGAFMKVAKMPDTCIRVYVGVADVAAALVKAEGLGAKTSMPKTDIGRGMGFAGSFIDPLRLPHRPLVAEVKSSSSHKLKLKLE